MHLVAVPDRVGAVGGLRAHDVRVRAVAQRVAQVLGQAVRNVDAEPVHALVAPEPQHAQELLADLRVIPVQVRLFLGEQVQVVPAVAAGLPRGAAEVAQPVGRRQFAVVAAAAPEHVPVAFRGAGGGGDRLLEPPVPLRRVVRDDVHDDADAAGVRLGDEPVEIVHRAESGVDGAVVGHVVPAVGLRRGVERGEPDGVHAEGVQIIETGDDAVQIAVAVAVAVGEGPRVDLVDDGVAPPVSLFVDGHSHASQFMMRTGRRAG